MKKNTHAFLVLVSLAIDLLLTLVFSGQLVVNHLFIISLNFTQLALQPS